jgi:hypothetical protein
MSPFPRPIPALLLLCLLSAGCVDRTVQGPPGNTFAFSDSENVYVVDTGRKLLKQVVGGGYGQARLSPDRTRLACVYVNDFYITVYDLTPSLDPDGRPKQVYNAQALSSEGSQGKCYFPTWSADGNRFYFLNRNHLVVYDYQEQHTTVVFDFPENQSAGPSYTEGNMAFSKDGGALYCMLQAGDQLAFWRVDPGINQGTQVGSMAASALPDFAFPPDLPEDLIETLFGSKEDPVLGPVPSPDGRYYFYPVDEKGFLAKQVLEGYDRTQKTKFDVVNLGLSIYSK